MRTYIPFLKFELYRHGKTTLFEFVKVKGEVMLLSPRAIKPLRKRKSGKPVTSTIFRESMDELCH